MSEIKIDPIETEAEMEAVLSISSSSDASRPVSAARSRSYVDS